MARGRNVQDREAPLQHHMIAMQGVEDRVQHSLGHLAMAVDPVVAVHEHLRFHDGDHAGLLAGGRIAGQDLRIDPDPMGGGRIAGDGIDLPPLGEARTLGLVLAQAFIEAVQAPGDQIAGGQGQGALALADLHARHDPLGPGRLRDRGAVIGLLTQGLLEQDDAAQALTQARGGDQQGAPCAPRLLGGLHADGGETLGDGGQALVRGQDPPAGLPALAAA